MNRLKPFIALMAACLMANSVSAATTAYAHNGEDHGLTVPGKDGPVQITHDANGIPTITAKTENDAQFGLGYAHAEDRLWQMEHQRRVANGRLAEVLGAPALNADRFFRTVGLRRAAEAVWANLSAEERQPLEAYVAGINQFLTDLPRTSGKQLPPEFGLLNVKPEPWTPVDVLAFGKLFAWSNGSNWDKEALRGQLAAQLGVTRTLQLTPAYLDDGPVIVPGDGAVSRKSDSSTSASTDCAICAALLTLHRDVAAHTGIGSDARGSNSWVISGARTTTGKPILANDPHLSLQTPSFWYLAHLKAGDLTVSGASVPGAPAIQIGHNSFIAWGVTTINVDSQDLYLEQINEQNEALYQGAFEPMQLVTETIKVKGAADVVLTVRSTRHGPLLSDAVNPAGPAMAVRWTGYDGEDEGLLATLSINRARDWRQFTQALRDHRAINMNYVYADANNIGYIAAGTVPIRAKGDGTFPVPGWTGEFEWQGYVPFDRLPQSYNPPQGYIVSSNNKNIGGDYPYVIGNSYAAPYRAARAVQMIEAKTKLSPADAAAMQADVVALHARRLLPALLRTKPADARSKQALDLLRRWDGRASGDSAATAIFEAWYARLAERLFGDEMQAAYERYSEHLYFVGMAVETALTKPELTIWCDDVTTSAAETCNQTLAVALSEGLAEMAKAQGSQDIATWRWEAAHAAKFQHVTFGPHPQLGPQFNRSIATDGDRFTVKVASSEGAWETLDQTHGPEYRQVVDFSNLPNSRWLIAPGQSGLPDSLHYDDMLQRWQRVEYLWMR
jgi:penicillin amidase